MGNLNTTPRTWVSGEIITATNMNGQVRDPLTALQAAWTTYVPSWTSSGTAPSVGNGSLAGYYQRIGQTIHFKISLTLGSTSTVGTGGYFFSLPFTGIAGSTNHMVCGVGDFFDSSANTDYGRVAMFNTNSTVQLNDATGTRVGATAPVVPATGDIITISGTYEAA